MEHFPTVGSEMSSDKEDDNKGKKPGTQKTVRVPLPFGEKTAEQPPVTPDRPRTIEDLALTLKRAFGVEERPKVEKTDAKTETAEEEPKEPAAAESTATTPEATTAEPSEAASLEQAAEERPADQREAEESAEEALDPDEQIDAGTRIAEARQAEIAAEQAAAEPGTTEAEAAAAAGEYYAQFTDNLAHGRTVETAAADAAEAVTGEPAPELPEMPEAVDTEADTTEIEPVAVNLRDEDVDETVPLAGGAYAAGGGGARRAGGGAPGGFGPGFAAPAPGNVPNAPATFETPHEPEQRHNDRFGLGLLIGVIAGEIHGRRSARKKTERRLAPVIKGLEKEVERIGTVLVLREVQVRQAVREKALAENQVAAAPVAIETAAKTVSEQRPAVAAAQAERVAEKKAEALKSVPRTVERMSTAEVVRVAETIVVGSQTVREIYENHLISERGLRNVVEAHLSGKEVQHVLADELMNKEKSYEQDPQLRDLPNDDAPETQAARTAAMQEQTGNALPPYMSPLQPTGAPASVPAQPPAPQQVSAPVPRGLVMANMVALVVLGLLLLVLFIIWLAR